MNREIIISRKKMKLRDKRFYKKLPIRKCFIIVILVGLIFFQITGYYRYTSGYKKNSA